MSEFLAVAMVVAVCALLLVGYPVALTLAGVSLGFAILGAALHVMNLALLGALPARIFGVMGNDVLLAIPLFIFMGVMLERSRIAEDLLETMGRLFGALPGGLGFSVIVVGVLLAAAKGVVGATTVTMGLIVLPTMLRHGYDKALAAGTVAATATLAQIFPPATVLVLLGDQLSNSYQAAQLAQGNFAPQTVSVADLFAGAIIPGLVLVLLYLLYLIGIAIFFPQKSPAIAPDPAAPHGFALARRLIAVLIAPIALILAVLGSILGGVATPTEAASVGAVGAILLAALRSGITGLLMPVMVRTTQITSMIFVILIGATLFSLVFRGLGGDGMVERDAHQPAGRRRRRDACGHGGAVPARLRHGRLRDHLRGGADRGAGAAQNAGRRSGLARHHDGGEPADLLHAPAARPDLVLSARRRAAGGHHPAHLSRHHSLCADPAGDAGRAVVFTGASDLVAAQTVRFVIL